jgi:hypothetical protein
VRQLSPLDAAFVYGETPTSPMHFCTVSHFPATVKGEPPGRRCCGNWPPRRAGVRGERGAAGQLPGVPLHLPGQVFTDLAVAIADGADAVSGIEVLRDRQALFGPVASMRGSAHISQKPAVGLVEGRLGGVIRRQGVGRALWPVFGAGPGVDPGGIQAGAMILVGPPVVAV